MSNCASALSLAWRQLISIICSTANRILRGGRCSNRLSKLWYATCISINKSWAGRTQDADIVHGTSVRLPLQPAHRQLWRYKMNKKQTNESSQQKKAVVSVAYHSLFDIEYKTHLTNTWWPYELYHWIHRRVNLIGLGHISSCRWRNSEHRALQS